MPIRVALGPRSNHPSWNWVGTDTAAELAKYYSVEVFGPGELPRADIVFIVKNALPVDQIHMIKQTASYVVYIPIDFFRDEMHIQSCADFLGRCDLIIIHAESLRQHFYTFAPTRYVDHHGKFFLKTLPNYKSVGYALWIGALQNLPYLLRYLKQHPLDIEIKILTNIGSRNARERALQVSSELNVDMKIKDGRINEIHAYPWSPSQQAIMLDEAKAAIDIKGEDFNQRFKPPTKAQKYICSGVPLAMNSSEAVRYFVRNKLTIPLPTDVRWLSREYFDEVQATALQLRPTLTLSTIGQIYRQIIRELFQR